MAFKRLSMRKIHRVLRLFFEAGLSIRAIARSIQASPSTVGEYIRRANTAGLSWPLPERLDERALEGRLFPTAAVSARVERPIPDGPACTPSAGARASRSRMGGTRRPRRNGCLALKHDRLGPVGPCAGGLPPVPPLRAADAAYPGHRGITRGEAPAGSRGRPARRLRGPVDRLPQAEFEVEPATAHSARPPPLGDGGVVPSARRVPFRRRLVGALPALWRHQKCSAVDPRRRRCRVHAGSSQSG